MITARADLAAHGFHPQPAHPVFARQHRARVPRELYTSPGFRTWFRDELPLAVSTAYSTGYSPLEEASIILSRFAAGARLYIEPDEKKPGDLKLLKPHSNWVWELKQGDVRIFGWFHAHDCFLAHSGGDATAIKENHLYDQHIADALSCMARTAFQPLQGDHHHVVTL